MKSCFIIFCSFVIASALPLMVDAQSVFSGITPGEIIKVTSQSRLTINIDTTQTPSGDYYTKMTFSDFKDSIKTVELTSFDPGNQPRQPISGFMLGGQAISDMGYGVDSLCYLGVWTGTSNGTLISYTLDPAYNYGPFTLWSNFLVTWNITSPDSGEVLEQGTTDTVNFTCTNPTIYSPDTVDVIVVLASGKIDTLASQLTNNPTSVIWTVPYMPTASNVYITVRTSDGVAAKSSKPFTIHGAKVTLDSIPAVVHPGSPDTIKWSSTDSVAPGGYTLEYTANVNADTVSWIKIAGNISSTDSSYVWNIPSTISKSSNAAEVKIIADDSLIVIPSNTFEFGATVAVNEPASYSFVVGQNYPNPFTLYADNGVTNVPFSLQTPQAVGLRVFDALGREVANTAPQWFNEGSHSLRFDGSQLSSGVYYYELTTNGNEASLRRAMLFAR